MAPSRPCTSTVATGRLRARVASVASATAASAPGTTCTFLGVRFQSTMTLTVAAPSASEVSAVVSPTVSISIDGSPASLPSPEAGASRPVAAYICPAMRTSPIPASMPSTTETEMARNQRPSPSAPMASCSTPATSTKAPSAGSPNSRTASKTSTVSPAAGPET